MMLSIVFLLMYVASSLRSGSAGFQQLVEYKKLAQKASDLEEQIRVYNTLKDEALRKQTSEQEQQVYQKLMDRLNLLQDQARDEKLALQKKAKENEEKEFALNQYQQLIRNIINTNVLAKSQIQHRDDLIVKKDATIEEKKLKMVQMESVITKNNQQINTIQSQLANQIQALREEQVKHKTSKTVLETRIASLRQVSETQVKQLEERNRGINQELGQVKSTLVQTEQKLGDTSQRLTVATETIEADRARYMAELKREQKAHADRLATERNQFESNLNKQRLSAEAKSKKLADFAAAERQKAAQLESQLGNLHGKIADAEKQLQGAQANLQSTQTKLANTEAERQQAMAQVEGLRDDLEKTRAIANARKQLAAQIANQFHKSGIKGNVDVKTGEVTIDFGEEYFETGSTSLKPKMKTTLDKFVPAYAKSLFADPKVADKIANVEIVGFASSTFKGRYVNPKSTNLSDKEAIDYNLRLSFGRANSIFKHVLNQSTLNKESRDRLLPLIKVVGRGYLPDGASEADFPDGMREPDFCKKFNCKKAQKVIIKFTMKD